MRRAIALIVLLWSSASFAQLYFVRDNTGQLYTVNTTTGAATLVATIAGITSSTIGATESPNPSVLFASSFQNLVSFNVNGTGATTIGVITGASIGQDGAEALGYCGSNNTLYGMINNNFFTVNQATGARIAALAAPGGDVEGLACNNATNELYGLDSGSGTLFRYAPGTNTWATVGSTGLSPDSLGLAYDPTAGVLYTVDGTAGNLYRISPATAASTLVGSLGLGAAGGGLAFVGAVAPAAPPAPVPATNAWVLALLALALAGISFRRFRGRFGR